VEGKLVWRIRRRIAPGTMTRVVAFCGIARPQQFFSALRGSGAELVGTEAFPDHHRYSQRDVVRLLKMQEKTRAEGFATTEKDAMNLGDLLPSNTQVVALQIELENPEEAVNSLLYTLEQRCGCRF